MTWKTKLFHFAARRSSGHISCRNALSSQCQRKHARKSNELTCSPKALVSLHHGCCVLCIKVATVDVIRKRWGNEPGEITPNVCSLQLPFLPLQTVYLQKLLQFSSSHFNISCLSGTHYGEVFVDTFYQWLCGGTLLPTKVIAFTM